MSDPLHLDDWGGTGPVLHLAHANGFPPGSYRKLIELLKPRYHVFTLRSRSLVPGTDPRALRDWEDLADDLAGALRARGLEGVVGVGHSMGGVATLLASVKHPGLFRAVVALDPVLFTGTRLLAIQALTLLGMRSRIPPASLARRRRETWGSREEAATSYRKKPLFRRRSRVLPGLPHPRPHRGPWRRLPAHHPHRLGGPRLRDLTAPRLAEAALGAGAHARVARERVEHAPPAGPGPRRTDDPRSPCRRAARHPPLPDGAPGGVRAAPPHVPRGGGTTPGLSAALSRKRSRARGAG